MPPENPNNAYASDKNDDNCSNGDTNDDSNTKVMIEQSLKEIIKPLLKQPLFYCAMLLSLELTLTREFFEIYDALYFSQEIGVSSGVASIASGAFGLMDIFSAPLCGEWINSNYNGYSSFDDSPEAGNAQIVIQSGVIDGSDTLLISVTTWRNTADESTIVENTGDDGNGAVLKITATPNFFFEMFVDLFCFFCVLSI